MSQRFRTLVELCDLSCSKYAERPLFGTRREGAWSWTSYRKFHELVDRFRGSLSLLGVEKGDRVAIVADNRLEWVVAAYASYGLEAAFVPMYRAQRPTEWQFILADCGAKVALAGNREIFEKVMAMRPDLPALEHVVGLEGPASDPTSFTALMEVDHRAPARSPDPGSIANFVYTSGTTGKPKGVLLTHENLTSNIHAVLEIFTFDPTDRSLSFLPWAHSFGQVEVNALFSMGASIAINDEVPRLLHNLAEVKPTILVAVPRIFTRIYEALNQEIAQRPAFLQGIIRAGLRSAIKRNRGERLSFVERLELGLVEQLVFAKIRERFGGRLKYAISGSATLGRDVAEFIDALGLTVYEGYGLSETSPIVAANLPGHRRFGSVGSVLPGVRVVIDSSVTGDPTHGEIIVYGPNVMLGYHNRPEENEKALLTDGGLRTGDLGYVDEDGFLYITGRIKEQYKLENGKYVMPSPLEEELKLSPYIANVMIDGDGRPFNVALVVIDEAAIRKWATEARVAPDDDLVGNPRVRALISREIATHARGFKEFEKPRDFAIVAEDFTPQNGLLTPTLKLRRREVRARYGALLDALYRPHPPAAAPSPAAPG
jgi:long-chain acyl-CoA synthetase